jgi:hypothetical protein
MRNDATGVENKCILSSMPGVGSPHPTGTSIHESESCMYGTNYRTLADSSRTGIGDNWKLGDKILEVKGLINANSMELLDFGLEEGYIVISERESNAILR